MMEHVANIWIWLGFSLFLIIALGIDTIFLDRKHARSVVSVRVAIFWTLFWVACALFFNGLLWCYIYLAKGSLAANKIALDFFTGYIIEKSLSVDNLFAFYVVFQHFRVPAIYQRRVFAYGIWGAVVMRLAIILVGTWLVQHFHWLIYVMGAFLLLTGIKMFWVEEQEKDLSETIIIRFAKRLLRVTHEFHQEHFFIKKKSLWYATPLFLALIFIEFSDLVFAFDSIPAIFAITQDPFIVWTSNIFAILGLRALYFLLANMITRFELLKHGIALILVFVGSKMVLEPWITISVLQSLIVIVCILITFVALSLRHSAK